MRVEKKRSVKNLSDMRLLQLVESLSEEISTQRTVIQELREELLCLAVMIGMNRGDELMFSDEDSSGAAVEMDPLEMVKLAQRGRMAGQS